jgi:tripartite-type tricarboxylate transporter receptor subunit TctC
LRCRAPSASPEIPTLVEKGLPFVRFGWLGVGSGTPQPIVSLPHRHIVSVVQSADYREMTEKAGSIALSSTPEDLAKILAETYQQTVLISREFGLQL